ncbi:MAG: hypothetical protein WBE38_06075 [Terracidiphilus sp.]|jgi:hypothetical protein
MSTQALLVEVLLSAFFAIACFRARSGSSDVRGLAPKRLFVLTDRIERLRISRWQWCSMVVLLLLVRMQRGAPMVAELTVLAQFIVFMVLPSQKSSPQKLQSQKPLREVLRRS